MEKSDREIMGKAGRRKMKRVFDESLVLDVYDQVVARYLKTDEVKSYYKKLTQ